MASSDGPLDPVAPQPAGVQQHDPPFPAVRVRGGDRSHEFVEVGPVFSAQCGDVVVREFPDDAPTVGG